MGRDALTNAVGADAKWIKCQHPIRIARPLSRDVTRQLGDRMADVIIVTRGWSRYRSGDCAAAAQRRVLCLRQLSSQSGCCRRGVVRAIEIRRWACDRHRCRCLA